MIAETVHWLSSFTIDQWFLMLGGLLFLDGPRYLFVSILFIFFDFFNESKKEKKRDLFATSDAFNSWIE